MRYVSTRDTSKTFEFKEVFIKGLADDGGLFIPETLVKYGENEIRDLKKLSYSELFKLRKKMILIMQLQVYLIEKVSTLLLRTILLYQKE